RNPPELRPPDEVETGELVGELQVRAEKIRKVGLHSKRLALVPEQALGRRGDDLRGGVFEVSVPLVEQTGDSEIHHALDQRAADARLDAAKVVRPALDIDNARVLVRRLLGRDVDESRRGVLAEESPLRAAQDLDPRDVEQP